MNRPRHPCDVLKSVLARYYPLRELGYLTSIGNRHKDFFEVEPPMDQHMADVLLELGRELYDAQQEVDDWFETMAPAEHAGLARHPARRVG